MARASFPSPAPSSKGFFNQGEGEKEAEERKSAAGRACVAFSALPLAGEVGAQHFLSPSTACGGGNAAIADNAELIARGEDATFQDKVHLAGAAILNIR